MTAIAHPELRILRYLRDDSLGFKYTEHVARQAGLTPDDAAEILRRLAADGQVSVIETDPDPCWQITDTGRERLIYAGLRGVR
jgi:hypothetical protein